MNGIRTNAAAVMLGVSPNTLRSWERRYDFPRPHRSPGGHRQYSLGEIEALRLALAETHNVSSAISLARERGEGPSSSSRLANSFAAFDEDKANRLLEESLTLRSIERTIEEVLLEAVGEHTTDARSTAEYEFAWRYATGLRTLLLSPAIEPVRLGRALRALDPRAVVLTGRRVTLDSIGRLVYAVRGIVQDVTVFDYRGAVPDTGASTVTRLGELPVLARDRLLERLDRPAPARVGPMKPAVAVRQAQA
jgi:DNA-binding transcriptional MerR regulator